MNCEKCGNRVMVTLNGRCCKCVGEYINKIESKMDLYISSYIAGIKTNDKECGERFALKILNHIEISNKQFKEGFFKKINENNY